MTNSLTKYGSVFGGLPGRTNFYFTAETLLECEGDKKRLWESLQQNPSIRSKTFLPAVREYKILIDEIECATAKALNNKQYGPGGGTMLHIANHMDVLEAVLQKQDLNLVRSLSSSLEGLLKLELQSGNSINYVDYDNISRNLYGIYLTKPINFKVAANLARLNIEYFEYSDNIFCAPEAGFICNDTKQFLSAIR